MVNIWSHAVGQHSPSKCLGQDPALSYLLRWLPLEVQGQQVGQDFIIGDVTWPAVGVQDGVVQPLVGLSQPGGAGALSGSEPLTLNSTLLPYHRSRVPRIQDKPQPADQIADICLGTAGDTTEHCAQFRLEDTDQKARSRIVSDPSGQRSWNPTFGTNNSWGTSISGSETKDLPIICAIVIEPFKRYGSSIECGSGHSRVHHPGLPLVDWPPLGANLN